MFTHTHIHRIQMPISSQKHPHFKGSSVTIFSSGVERGSQEYCRSTLCPVFKDKFIFVRDMKHSLTLVFGTVLIG